MKIEWKCKLCNSVRISDSSIRHSMDYCECGKTGLDLEEGYCRIIGGEWYEKIGEVGNG
jgi:hypothetical protein